MEEVLIVLFIVLPLAILAFVLPIVAIVKASGAKGRVKKLEKELERLEDRVTELTRRREEEKQQTPQQTAAPTKPTAAYSVQETVTAPAAEPTIEPEPEAARGTESAPELEETIDPAVHEPPPFAPGTSIEERIGVVWFTRIGAVVGMVAAGWFFKYMVDNDWIGPWGRIAVGALVGATVLGLGEFLYRRGRTHAMFNQGLLGLGLALLLITAYASFGFYHLVPVVTAFAVAAVLCLLGGALSHVHKSELILVFSLLAAFLNPIMLSSGVDRPVALFSYLFLMTAAAYVPAIIHGYRAATFIAPAGVVLLFIGWYGKYFDISSAPPFGLYDDPEMNRPGAYLSMAVRWIPLLFAVLFTGEWIGAALLHLRKNRRVTGIVLLLLAATMSHGATAALLYDKPLMLGIALLAFGLLFAVLLTKNKLTEWLFLTMTSSFVILACLKNRLETGDVLPVMLISGLLSAFYFGIFLRVAVKKDRRPSAIVQWLIAGSGLGFFGLGALFLMPDHPMHLAGFAASLTGVFMLTAVVIASPVLSIGASITGFIGLLIADTERATETDAVFIAIAGGWFLLHTGIIAYDALKRRQAWTAVHMAVLSFAGIGFAGLFLYATSDDEGTLRALLAIGEGIVYLVVGLAAIRDENTAEHAPLLPLGMAALSFTAATAFLLSGASLTAAWASEAAVLAYLAAKSREQNKDAASNIGWILASLALFITAISHLFVVDVRWLSEVRSAYLNTDGANGTLLPTAFMHPLAWGLIAVSTALLLAVFFLRKHKDTLTRSIRLGFLISGHSGLLWLFIHEFRLIFTLKPDIPAGLPSDEMSILWGRYLSAAADQAMQLQTVTTVVMGVFALLLLAVGFAVRDAWHRRLGMILFAVTLTKLSLFDIWKFETLLRIIVGGAVAFLLLLSGFLYARFGHRLKAIVSDAGDKFIGIAFLVALNAAPTPEAIIGPTETHAQTAPITGINAAGDYVIEVPPALYQASLSGESLGDIRILGPSGVEIPYALFSAERTPSPRMLLDAELLDPQVLPGGAFRVVLDLGEAPPVHRRAHLRLAGTDFLRVVQVESSADNKTYGVIQGDERVYDIPSAHTDATKRTVDYPVSGSRYLRITLQKGMDNADVRILSAQCETVGKRAISDATREIPLPLDKVFEDTDANTIYPMAALPKKIPFDSLRIETDGQEFVRHVEVETSTHKNAWFSQGTWPVFRIRRGSAGAAAIIEQLILPTGRLSRPQVRLKIDNGDNTPLDITAVYARYTADALVLRTASAGLHTLYVGSKLGSGPRYDLATLLNEGSFSKLLPATLGPLSKNTKVKHALEVQKSVPWTENHARLIQISVLVLSLLLLLWSIKLLKKNSKKQ